MIREVQQQQQQHKHQQQQQKRQQRPRSVVKKVWNDRIQLFADS